MGQVVEHQPVLSDALHPGADVGNQRAQKPPAVIGHAKGSEGSRPVVFVVRQDFV